jgi:hypothetical protein
MSVRAWSLLIYAMVGSAEEKALLIAAVADMRRELATEECAIAVQINTNASMERHWITRAEYEEQVQAMVDASDERVLTAFIDAASRRLPATSTALLIWAHGSGLDTIREYVERHSVWPQDGSLPRPKNLPKDAQHLLGAYKAARRLGPQWGTKRFLTNPAVRSAIAQSQLARVELLGFNACWMAMFEVGYEMRDVAEVQVFSQVYATTWPYGEIIKSFSRQPAQSAADLGRTIVRSVRAELASGAREDAVSVIALAPLGKLFQLFDDYAVAVTALVTSDFRLVYEAVMQRAQRVDDPHQVDLRSLVAVLRSGKADVVAAARGVETLLENDVILDSASHPDHQRIHGLSIFCPRSTKVDREAAYGGLAFRTSKWAGFLLRFREALRAMPHPMRRTG